MIWLSLPMGLLSWMIPIVFHKKKPGTVSTVSFGLCGLALLNVLWELYGRTVSGDYAALMDITDNLLWCSIALVVGTVLLNLRLYLPKQAFRRRLARISPFWSTLILQTMYFLGVAVYAAYFGSHTTGYHLGIRSGLLGLALAVILLTAYRMKTRKQELSLQVAGAVLVFPAAEFLLFYLAMFLPGSTLPYEYDDFLRMVLLCYSLPALVLSLLILNIGPMVLENLRDWLQQQKAAGKSPVPAFISILSATVIAVISMILTLQSPDIHLEKGAFLMLEADAPMFFAVAFGVVTLSFGLFLLALYRKRHARPGMWCFILQWALTLLAFHFLMTGLTLRPGDVGGMYTETVSGHVGLAGLSWAASILFMGIGLRNIFVSKEQDSHEAE